MGLEKGFGVKASSREDIRKLGVIARQLTLKRGEVRAISFVYPDSSPYYAKEKCAVFLLPPILRKKWFKLDLELLKGIGKMKSMRNMTRRLNTVGISKRLLQTPDDPIQPQVMPLDSELLGGNYKKLLAVTNQQLKLQKGVSVPIGIERLASAADEN